MIDHLGLDDTKDMPLARAWAKTEILATEAYRYVLDELEKGELNSRLLSEWRQATALQLQLSKELGLTPSARIALGLDIQRGRQLNAAELLMQARLRRQQQELEGQTPPEDRRVTSADSEAKSE